MKHTLCLFPALFLASGCAAGVFAETAAEGNSIQTMDLTKKFFEIAPTTYVVLALLIVLGVLLYLAGRRVKWNSSRIANAAMCIAIAFVLSCLRLYRMPNGGSITPLSMLPLIAFSVACGPLQGCLVGCAYGLLQLLSDPYVIHPMQLLVDYPFAFGAIALAGLVNYLPLSEKWKLPVGVILGTFGRYVMAVLSGTIFFAEYAPVGQSALVYSLVYNISYLGPDALLCLIFSFVPGIARIVKMLRGNLQAA